MSIPTLNIDVAVLPKSGKCLTLSADRAGLLFLRENTEAEEVVNFEAELVFKPWKMNGAWLKGTIRTELVQICVNTLEPIDVLVEFEVSRSFLPASDPLFGNQSIVDGELVIDPEADELPDYLEGTSINVWDVVLEELNLQIDPFPRLADSELDEKMQEVSEPDTHKPF